MLRIGKKCGFRNFNFTEKYVHGIKLHTLILKNFHEAFIPFPVFSNETSS